MRVMDKALLDQLAQGRLRREAMRLLVALRRSDRTNMSAEAREAILEVREALADEVMEGSIKRDTIIRARRVWYVWRAVTS